MSLAPDESGTRLTYVARAQVGGKLAQVGSRLIDGVAKKMAEDFFGRFRARFAPMPSTEARTPAVDRQAAIDATSLASDRSVTGVVAANAAGPRKAINWTWGIAVAVAVVFAAILYTMAH